MPAKLDAGMECDATSVSRRKGSNSGGSKRVKSAPPRARATIRAVAERADVAISTVSRVVNGGSTSAAARQRVVAAIRELGYTPSIAAQSLVSRRTGCVGLVVNSSQSTWFSQILLAIEEALAPSRKSVVLASMMLSGEYDPTPVSAWLNERRVDGLIFVRHSARDEFLLDAAQEAGIPAVFIAPDLPPEALEWCSSFTVRSDNLHAGRLAAQHLLDYGHERIGFAGGPETSVDTRLRLKGAHEGLAERAAMLDPACTWYGEHFGIEAGRKHAHAFLALPPERRPSAMILGNDSMALAFMRELLSAGLKVPSEVSVIGFDGTPDGERFWPSLTTVVQPTRDMAAEACRRLLAVLADAANTDSTQQQYPVELVVRESTARR